MRGRGKVPNTKFGRQPFMDMILESKKTYGEVADEMGISYRHLRNAGYGYMRPKFELRNALVERFKVDLDQLFTEDALKGKPHYGEKGRALIRETREQKRERLERKRAEADSEEDSPLPEAS